MLGVVEAKHLSDYRIWVEFGTGEQGEVDLARALWGPVFEPLRDLEMFRRFAVSPVLQTIAWENGADLDPEFLRDQMLEQKTLAIGMRGGVTSVQ